jgi:hypothetical protein
MIACLASLFSCRESNMKLSQLPNKALYLILGIGDEFPTAVRMSAQPVCLNTEVSHQALSFAESTTCPLQASVNGCDNAQTLTHITLPNAALYSNLRQADTRKSNRKQTIPSKPTISSKRVVGSLPCARRREQTLGCRTRYPRFNMSAWLQTGLCFILLVSLYY